MAYVMLITRIVAAAIRAYLRYQPHQNNLQEGFAGGEEN
jgi:hypothetical protein